MHLCFFVRVIFVKVKDLYLSVTVFFTSLIYVLCWGGDVGGLPPRLFSFFD
jgi:hypothetical protein